MGRPPSKVQPATQNDVNIDFKFPTLTQEQLEKIQRKLTKEQFSYFVTQLHESERVLEEEKKQKSSCHAGQTIRNLKTNEHYVIVWTGKGQVKNHNLEVKIVNLDNVDEEEIFNTGEVKDTSLISMDEMAKLMKVENAKEFSQNFATNRGRFEV